MLVQEETAIYSKYESQIRDNISIVLNARKGLSSKAYYDIILLSGFKKEQIAQLFNTSAKTITRYTQENKNLDIVSSEPGLDESSHALSVHHHVVSDLKKNPDLVEVVCHQSKKVHSIFSQRG